MNLIAVYAVGKARRRNGAQNWCLYRDMADPQLYSERFIVESWLEYLRQQVRVTQADHAQQCLIERFRREDLADLPAVREILRLKCSTNSQIKLSRCRSFSG